MKLLLLSSILLYLVHPSNPSQAHRIKVYKERENAFYFGRRFIQLMQTIHRDARHRHHALNHLRFMYEESPHYEMGYIMGEIIERYKKMVSHVRRRFEWEGVIIFDMIRRVQTVQFLYIEIYHLERMMHEIELKYKDNLEFMDIHTEMDMGELAEHQEAERLEMENIAIKKKQQLKKLRKVQKKYLQVNKQWKKFEVPNKRPKGIWPIEYGWDIGSEWQAFKIPYSFGRR